MAVGMIEKVTLGDLMVRHEFHIALRTDSHGCFAQLLNVYAKHGVLISPLIGFGNGPIEALRAMVADISGQRLIVHYYDEDRREAGPYDIVLEE